VWAQRAITLGKHEGAFTAAIPVIRCHGGDQSNGWTTCWPCGLTTGRPPQPGGPATAERHTGCRVTSSCSAESTEARALIVTRPGPPGLVGFSAAPESYERALTIEPGGRGRPGDIAVWSTMNPRPQRLRVDKRPSPTRTCRLVASSSDPAGPVAPGAVAVLQSSLNIADPRRWQGHTVIRTLYRTVVTLLVHARRRARPRDPAAGSVAHAGSSITNKGFMLNGEHQYLKVRLHSPGPPGEGRGSLGCRPGGRFRDPGRPGRERRAAGARTNMINRSYELADTAGIVVMG